MKDKRIVEASALRLYFQEQWDQLMGLLEKQSEKREALLAEEDRLEDAIESIVTRTDSRMRAISRYQKRLREGTKALLLHIDQLVDELPQALLISRESFLHDPQVSAFFSRLDEVTELCNQFYDMHDYLLTPEHKGADEIFFILFLRYKEKSILGSEIRGDILLREVEKTSVVFSGHQVLAPSMTEAEVRLSLKQTLFDNVVRYMRSHIIGLKHDQQKSASGIIHHDEDLRNPEVYLTRILEYLALPQELIKILENTIRVDRMGIKVEKSVDSDGAAISLSELEIGDDYRQLLSMVRVPREILDF
ncbi:MAG: hypothetical protein ABW162_07415 [Candidatus Sedimenticola sp. PURPLELP]